MKKLIIVGAGIAGLTAGIYAKQSGFDVTIYESHSIPGGACTGWRRQGYYYEGGIHWMMGVSPKHPLNKVWREIGALNNEVRIHSREPFLTVEQNGKRGYIYRDIRKLRQHFLELSPEDKKEINLFCKDIQRFTKFKMPIRDIKGVKLKNKESAHLLSVIHMLPAFSRIAYYANQSSGEFAKRFKSPIIRKLIENTVGSEYSAIAMIINLANLASGDGGYPEGGSLAMASRMAKYYESLGGQIYYNRRVTKVSVNNGECNGVLINEEFLPADAVIITPDTLTAIDNLFEVQIKDSWAQLMRLSTKPMLNTFICLGIKEELTDEPEAIDYILEKPFSCGGIEMSYLPIYNYAGYPGYSPKGCTVITSIIPGDCYEYWKNCKVNGTYEEEKKMLAESFIEILSEKIPKIKGKIATWDVATPLTYERYLGSYKGSWMTIIRSGNKMEDYPSMPESIKNVYFASQRLSPPGGLSGAAETGRRAVQYLCRDIDTVFQGNK